MVIEVIPTDIGQDADIKLHAGHPPLVQRMRRGLHHHGLGAIIDQASHPSLNAHGIGRGVGCQLQCIDRAVTQRAKVSRRVTQFGQGMRQQIRRGCLAIRAGNANAEQFPRRPLVVARRDLSGMAPKLRNRPRRNRDVRRLHARLRLPQHGGRTIPQRFRQIVQAMRFESAAGQEQATAADPPRVALHSVDGNAQIGGRVHETVDQAGQLTRPLRHGHHHVGDAPSAEAVSPSGADGSKSAGGIRSSRAALFMTLANTGAAMTPP